MFILISATAAMHIQEREIAEKDPSNPELTERLWGNGYKLTGGGREAD